MQCTLFAPALESAPSDFLIAEAPPPRPSWSHLCAIEPRLAIIEADARRLHHSRNRWHAYEALKRRLHALVGWSAADARLATADAYDVAVSAILTALETGGRR